MLKKLFFGASFAAIAIVAGVALTAPRNNIPDHMLGHPLIDLENFFTEKEVDDLLQFTRDQGVIPPLAREYDSYTPLHDHIGEATDLVNGACPPYLIPNKGKKQCVFPGRIDVGRHFIRSGGPGAIKQSFSSMVTRVYGFMKYIYNYTEYELPNRLLHEPKFQKLAKDVCPTDKQILDPVQLNLVVQLPGQTVATHIDAVYFDKVSRFHYPQWVGAVMAFSGLFKKEFIDQVQVVGYYHKWTDNDRRSGNFKFWNSKDIHPQVSRPISRSANSVDGSKVVHAADVYMPDQMPPKLPMDAVNELHFNKETKEWDVISDGKLIRSYNEDDIRFSVVYRARCFADQAAVDKYHEDQKTPTPLEDIWDVFRADLVKKGIITEDQQFSPYDWGLLLLDTYIKYPLSPTAIIPYNYCALDRVYPFMSNILPWIGCK